MKRQQEFEAARREDERKRKIADNLTKLADRDQPEAYLLRFEDTMKQAGIPQQEWPHRLRRLLTGSALTAYSRDVPEDAKESYPEFKEALLNALGLSVKQCRLDLWNLRKTPEETYQETARKIEFMTNCMLYGCHCIPDVHKMLSLSKFLTVCPPEAVYYLQLNSPKSTVEAANLVQEYFHNQPNREHLKFTRFNQWHRNGERDGRGGFREGTRRVDTPNAVQRESHRQGELHTTTGTGSQQGGRAFPKTPSSGRQVHDKVPVCFQCGQRGHKRPDCPDKIARIQIPTGGSCPRVEGKIGKVPCSMLVDTGAEKTVVSAELVQPEQSLGKTIPLICFDGGKMHAPIAKVWIKVGEYGISAEVAVISNAPEMVYLGVDLGITKYLLELHERQAVEMMYGRQTISAITRELDRREKEEEEQDLILSMQDQACSVSSEQLDRECDPEGDPNEQAIARALTDDDLGEPLPLPQLTENNSDRELLAKQQLRDHLLHSLREGADKGKSEYSWKDGVLVHTLEDEGGETSVHIVVPVDRRTQVLRLAHSTLTG